MDRPVRRDHRLGRSWKRTSRPRSPTVRRTDGERGRGERTTGGGDRAPGSLASRSSRRAGARGLCEEATAGRAGGCMNGNALLPRVVAFYAYKGGTGRTTALVHAGWALARGGRRVVMLDLD